MRLVCPNCEAKYEVPDDAIPDSGRDVQCASCGHAWYQMRPRSGAVEAAAAPVAPEAAAPEPDPVAVEAADASDVAVPDDVLAGGEADSPAVVEQEAEPDAEPVPDPHAGLAAEPESEPEVAAVETVDAAAEPATVAAEAVAAETVAADTDADLPGLSEAVAEVGAAGDETAEAEAELGPEPVADGKAAYAVDDSVLAILREEAERESSARRAEARPLEVQADLGIDSAVAAPLVAAAAVAVEDKPSARRDLLPDVEEINSTLRPSETEEAVQDSADGLVAAPRSGGFRSGFLWVMTIAMLGAGLYLAAPTLSRSVPALAGPLEGYVRMVNGLRLELDGLMRSATVALDGE